MRLCYLADPTSTHTVKWLRYFIARGDEVHLLGWNAPTDDALRAAHYHHLPDELRPPFVRVVRGVLWHLRMWPIAVYRQMQLLLERIRPDIFDILMINAPQLPAALAWRGPLVVTPWGHDLLVFPKQYGVTARAGLRAVMRRSDLVLCNSLRLEQAARAFGARPECIRRVGQIVDLERFRPRLDTTTVRQQLGIGDSPVLLSPRRLDPDYRIETIVRSLPHILAAFPTAQLVLLGERTLFPDYVASLDAEIARLGVAHAVVFAGWVGNDTMPQLFNLADVVVSVPYSDSRPSSLFEAMACGVPVIASDLESIREFVHDGETGLLMPVDDSSALAAATLCLLTNGSRRQSITDRALDFVRRDGDMQRQMAKVATYYDELLRN